MSIPKSIVTRSLVLSIFSSVALCIPAAKLATRAGCPAGPNGQSNYQILAAGQTCQDLAAKYNTSYLDVADLNFAGANCTNDWIAGHQVCIPPPCNAYKVQPGDTCSKIASAKNIPGGLAAFFGYNPGLNNPSCNNLQLDTNVCLSAPNGTNFPAPQPTVPVIQCTKNYTAIKGDSCDGIAAKFNLTNGTTNLFFALNPTVHNPACDNINIGEVYCVGNATTVALAQPASSSTVKCAKLYTVKAGDSTCDAVAKENGLASGAAFEALNPTTINASCSNLVIGMQYCVKKS